MDLKKIADVLKYKPDETTGEHTPLTHEEAQGFKEDVTELNTIINNFSAYITKKEHYEAMNYLIKNAGELSEKGRYEAAVTAFELAGRMWSEAGVELYADACAGISVHVLNKKNTGDIPTSYFLNKLKRYSRNELTFRTIRLELRKMRESSIRGGNAENFEGPIDESGIGPDAGDYKEKPSFL